jgi:hypothetical protein
MSKNAFGYIEQLPENIKDAFMWLCQDVASLQHKWDFYLELFGKSENTDLLSELAPASFNIIFETLQNDITMAICRLSDPPKSMGQENLSLSNLVKTCVEIEGLDDLLNDFKKICKPIRQRRNKRVGHRDLNTAIKPLEHPLPGVSKEQIDLILKTTANILNSILKNYDDREMYFHTVSRGGVESLIYWLKMGKVSKSRTKNHAT